jgi:hypothetical protein
MVKGTVCKTVVRWFDSNYGLKIHGGYSSEEEHLVVVQDVVGSSPTNHPKIGYPACSVRGYKTDIG